MLGLADRGLVAGPRLRRDRLRQYRRGGPLPPGADHHRRSARARSARRRPRLLLRRIKAPDARARKHHPAAAAHHSRRAAAAKRRQTERNRPATSAEQDAGPTRRKANDKQRHGEAVAGRRRLAASPLLAPSAIGRGARRRRRRPTPRRLSRSTPARRPTWEGPTKAPKPEPGKKIVFLSGDEQNDISHLYGVYIKEAGEKLGWNVTIIDGKGSPTSWLAGLNQAIALKPDGIAMFADAASLQDPIKAGVAQGIKFVGLHAAGLPGPQPDLNLFVNIQEDPREIGKAEADWAIADSDGKARVVILSHNEYAIAEVKSMATKDEIEKCARLQGARLRQLARLRSRAAPAAAHHELGSALRPAALCDFGRRQRLGLRRAGAARGRRRSQLRRS